MSINKIKAMLLMEFYLTIHSVEIILDMVVLPSMTIVLFGFLSRYLIGVNNNQLGQSLLMGMILWQVIVIMEFSIAVGSLWSIWSRNLSNIFVTPISVPEYIFSYVLSGILKVFIILGVTSALIYLFFKFNILQIPLFYLFVLVANLIAFAFSMGMIILGLIFRFGTRIQSLSWGLLPIIQPLVSVLYPVHILPWYLQVVSYLMPPTYIFETARALLKNPHFFNWNYIAIGVLENVIFFGISLLFFNYMFKKSKETGQFARNEST